MPNINVTAILQAQMKYVMNAGRDTETITYTPFNGTPISIEVYVERNPIGSVVGLETIYADLSIWVLNDALLGVTSVNVGGDSVNIKMRKDEAAQDMKISQVLFADDSIIHLKVG